MGRPKMQQILSAPDKGASKTPGINGVLSRLFRLLMIDMKIDAMRWGSLMNAYIKDARNDIPNNRRDQTSIRGNLTKEFARPQMTWKVFMKAMRFLQVSNVKITIEVTHSSRPNPTLTSVNIPLTPAAAVGTMDEELPEQKEEDEDDV